jgi:predicted transcriptional regulator
MSIVSKQARKILQGTKKYEFRKNIPRIEAHEPLRVIMYSSQEDKAIIGGFAVGQVLREPLDRLMELTGYASDPEAIAWFTRYYAGRSVCNALEVVHPQQLESPIGLDELRTIVPGFRPPQNFIYLPTDSPLVNVINSRWSYHEIQV